MGQLLEKKRKCADIFELTIYGALLAFVTVWLVALEQRPLQPLGTLEMVLIVAITSIVWLGSLGLLFSWSRRLVYL
jgi:hypothetical protein